MRLKLSRPIKPFILGQNYGEDLACVDTATYKKVIARTSSTCPSGYTSLYTAVGLKAHNGLDLNARRGQPLYSSTDGAITEVCTEEARGLGIGIVSHVKYRFDEVEGEYQAKTRYWHLQKINVVKGQYVREGQLIGWADNTGYSAGDHLHYELKPVKDGKNVLQDNGYRGAIDPINYMAQLYAYEINSVLTRIRYQLLDIMVKVANLLSK